MKDNCMGFPTVPKATTKLYWLLSYRLIKRRCPGSFDEKITVSVHQTQTKTKMASHGGKGRIPMFRACALLAEPISHCDSFHVITSHYYSMNNVASLRLGSVSNLFDWLYSNM